MSEGLILAGRYQLFKQLGAGGMGSVWQAYDHNLGADVAIKLIDPALADSSDALARFRREAQAAAAIRSTHVVQILDHGIDQGMPYIAMELLKGESLAQRLERVGVLELEQTARLLGHVARALSLAHEHGIVHRDMKPENIFLVREDDEDIGKVLDFGIARKRGGLADSGGLKTATGALLGTPYYMSPEQASGQAVDHRTDIWSFGAIVCECLTGRRVFDAESLGALFHSICIAELPVPSKVAAVPPGFDAWFARATARDLTYRFQTIKEAADSLRPICGANLGRASAAFLPGSRDNEPWSGDSATRGTTADAVAYDSTSPPSSKTIPGRSNSRNLRSRLLLVSTIAIVVGGGTIGWRWHKPPSPFASPDSVGAPVLSSTAEAPPPRSVTALPLATHAVPSPALPARVEHAANKAPAPKGSAASTLSQPPIRPAQLKDKPAKIRPETLVRDKNAAGI